MDFMASDRSTEDWLSYLGDQIRESRIRQDVSQEELATASNVSLSTVKNLEGGKGSSMATLIQVVRALNRTDWLNALAPPATVSPMQMLKRSKGESGKSRVGRRMHRKE